MQLGSESTTRRPARLVLYVTGRSSCAHTWRVSGCTFTMMTRLPISLANTGWWTLTISHRWPGAGVNSTRSAGPASPFLAVLQDASPAPGIVASGDTGPASALQSSALAVLQRIAVSADAGSRSRPPAFPLAFDLAALAALTLPAASA